MELSARRVWSIIIFGRNERPTLEALVARASAILGEIGAEGSEIVLVDDGSTDGSPAEMRRLAEQFRNVQTVFHEVNRGIGESLLSGYRAARGAVVVALPGDGQFDVNELRNAADIASGEVISFYRRSRPEYGAYRRVLSGTNNVLNRWIGGIQLRDVNWVKVYPADFLRTARPQLRSSLVESELVGKAFASGYRFREVPSDYLPRQAGRASGASWAVVRRAFVELVRLYVVLAKARLRRPQS